MKFMLSSRDIQFFHDGNNWSLDMSGELLEYLNHYHISSAEICWNTNILGPYPHLDNSRNLHYRIVNNLHDPSKVVDFYGLSLIVRTDEEKLILSLSWDGRYEDP